jgi:hypothetical protein
MDEKAAGKSARQTMLTAFRTACFLDGSARSFVHKAAAAQRIENHHFWQRVAKKSHLKLIWNL